MSNKRSQEDWKNEVEKYKKSGLSVNGYCRVNNISPSTFMYWKKKYAPSAIETPSHHLVKVPNPMKIGDKMRLSYNQVVVEFPAELSASKIAHLISALKEV
jgi:hypothetical protein